VLGAVRAKVGRDYPVWCRIDCREFGVKNGLTPEDARSLAVMLEEAGADAIHVSGYGGVINGFIDAPLVYSKCNLVPYAAEIKKLVNIPVIAVGRISLEEGESLLEQGKADFIALARPLVVDPELPNKLAEGKRADVRPCVFCYKCVGQHLHDEPTLCTINVATGAEAEYRFVPAEKPKHIVVVGGGAAGMEAARLLTLKGHRVILLERQGKLGGSLNFATIVNEDNDDYLKWIKLQVAKLPVEIRLGQKITPEVIIGMKADAVIVAVGPKLIPSKLKGAGNANVITGKDLREMLGGRCNGRFSWWLRVGTALSAPVLRQLSPSSVRRLTKVWMPVGKNAVVIGGDLAAVELAKFLLERGRKVTLLADGAALAPEMSIPMRWRIVRGIRKGGVTIHTEVACDEITSSGVEFTDALGKKQQISADTVIIAGETAPNDALYQALIGKVNELYRIGDCGGQKLLRGAMEDAAKVCLYI